MKKQFLKLLSFLMIIAGVAASCNPEEQYPKEIYFTEYSLIGTSCQWINLPSDDKVLIINSNDELYKYVSLSGTMCPDIDFSKKSLLLVSGYVTGSVSNMIVKDLKQVSSNKLIWNLEINLTYKDISSPWSMALIVEKVNDDFDVMLNLALHAPKIIRPVTIMDENIIDFFHKALYIDDISPCFFTDSPSYKYKDTCFMINTLWEFQQACACSYNLPEIDFDRFTLIIGKHIVPLPNIIIFDQKIIEDNVLTLLIQKEQLNTGSTQNVAIQNHWGIYPKLPNKQFFVEYKFIWE